ncbi:MAG: hypothetical protein AAB354_12470 [candidate division KSB1 bacterium]
MSLNLKNALALLQPQEQAEVFKHLAEHLHQPNLVALAEYYEMLLEQNLPAEETPAPTQPILYRTTEARTAAASNRVREDIATYGAPAKAPLDKFEEFYATFDGEVFKPENKIVLAPSERYRLLLARPETRLPEIKNRAFREIAALAVPMGIRDLAEQHDHYLYGTPKRK